MIIKLEASPQGKEHLVSNGIGLGLLLSLLGLKVGVMVPVWSPGIFVLLVEDDNGHEGD